MKQRLDAVPVVAFLNNMGTEHKLSFEPMPEAQKHVPLVQMKHSVPATEKELKKLSKESIQFSADIYRFINWMDEEMKKPSDNDRGKRIAKAMNALEMCADRFSHFALKQSFEQINKAKSKKPKPTTTGDQQ